MSHTTDGSRHQWFGQHFSQLLWGMVIAGAVVFAFTNNVVGLIIAVIAASVVISREASWQHRR